MKTAHLTTRPVPLSLDLIHDANPRTHAPKGSPEWAALKTSLLSEYFDPLIFNARNGKLVSGAYRTRILIDEGFTDAVMVVVDWDEPTHRARMLAANRHSGSDDETMMTELLRGLDDGALLLTGITAADLQSLLRSPAAETVSEPEFDRRDELLKKWGVERGQLWIAGEHRLLCGDSTNVGDVARLLTEPAKSLIFDPEWNDDVPDIRGEFENTLAFTDGQRAGDVVRRFGDPAWVFIWDCGSCWFTPNRPLKKSKLCLWYGDVNKYDMNGAHYGDAGEQREVSNSRGSYTFKPDPRGKHLADIFSKPITKVHAEVEHSHSKPVDWIRLLIGNCTAGDVFDPFCGSGVSIIACQQLGRRGRGIEISPGNVAVALEWMESIGLVPKKSNG